MSELQKAKQAVMDEVGYVFKDGKMTQGGSYRFASESAFIAALRSSMIKHGLSLVPTEKVIHTYMDYQTAKGTSMMRVLIACKYALTHVSGESETIETLGEACDSSDKSVAKAQTIAKKYALREVFLVETGDDPDHERPELPTNNGHVASTQYNRLLAYMKTKFGNAPDTQKRAEFAKVTHLAQEHHGLDAEKLKQCNDPEVIEDLMARHATLTQQVMEVL